MKLRFVIAATLLFVISCATISFLQFQYFDQERLRLIDQQIERTISVLSSSKLSRSALLSLEEAEDLIFEVLEDDPPNQVIMLRRPDGTLFYKNRLATTFALDLPVEPARNIVTVEGHRLRYINYLLPKKQLLLQVGLVLDQREIHWNNILGSIVAFCALAIVLFILLALLLANYLLRPVKALADYFQYQALEGRLPAHPPEVADTREFRHLSAAISSVTQHWQNSLEHYSSVTARLIHEIRTPLTVLRNRLEALQNGTGAPEVQTKEAMEELMLVESLTSDYMSWTRLAYGKPAETELHAIPLREFVEKLACVKDGQVELDLGVPPHHKVFAKPEHLRMILENLVRNARQHGEAGRPVRLVVNEHCIEVRNFGPPVPEAVVKNLGKPFNRGAESAGTGLGLANTLSLVKKYGWSLEILREGDETVFVVNMRELPH